ncbi:MAG: alpha/beta hydrolase [Hyphomonadaceae bacterium]|nr:alpha/beta hydrolase [Hyphomonadaceae bacterium]
MSEADEPFRRVWYDVPGGRMAGIAFGAQTPNPDIVFLHATGFNARTYRALLQPLSEKFHVLALDLRGHGRTELPARLFGYASWRPHRDDVIALIERHFSAPVTLAGHSMGATVSLLIAGRRNDLVSGLALVDPVILPAAGYAMAQAPLGPLLQRHTLPIARGARKRRSRFPDRAAALEAYRGRGVFKSFSDDVLADYLADGLIDDPAGGVKLSCTPIYEAATFAAHRHDPWTALRRVTDPLVLLRAERHSTISVASMHRLCAIKPDARAATVEGAGHMLPMERPDRVRAAIESAALLARAGRKYNHGLD